MARARFYDVSTDPAGRPVAGVTVNVYVTGTTTPLPLPIYAAATGGVTRANPFVTATGVVDFWLEDPATVDLKYTVAGYGTQTQTVEVVEATPPATAVTVTPVGNLVATTAQAAFAELDAGLTAEAGLRTAADALLETPAGAAAKVAAEATLRIAGDATEAAARAAAIASLNGTYAPVSEPLAVHLIGAETITGAKTFNAGKLLDKGSIVFDVKAFGATGDGTTNDRAAVQAAIDAASAAGGGTVLFPVGTFSIQTLSLDVPSHVQLLGTGRGSVIKDGTGNLILLGLTTGSTNISVRSLRFTGQGVLGTAGRGAVWTTGTSKLTVSGCYFDALGTCGISGDGITDSTILGNFIDGGAEHGIYLSSGCADVLVIGNHIKNPGGNGGVSTVVGIKIANGAARCVILGNSISTSIAEGVIVDGAVDTLIASNVIRANTQRGVRVLAGSTGTRISGNVFKANGTGPIRDFGAVGTVIEGNTFDEALDAVYLDSAASRTIVRNNRWVAANPGGWALDVTADNVLVEGNDFSSGVANALVIRAAANATHHRLNRYNVSGVTVSDSGTATIPVANADTSGATLGALETEVNELKALLRAVDLLAT